jgi:hypothetical protein
VSASLKTFGGTNVEVRRTGLGGDAVGAEEVDEPRGGKVDVDMSEVSVS